MLLCVVLSAVLALTYSFEVFQIPNKSSTTLYQWESAFFSFILCENFSFDYTVELMQIIDGTEKMWLHPKVPLSITKQQREQESCMLCGRGHHLIITQSAKSTSFEW